MRQDDLIRGFFYAGVLFAIESKIHDGDRKAASQGIRLTDSNVRSLLVKAAKAVQGRPPQPAPESASPKDKQLAVLLQELIAVKDSLVVDESLPDGSVKRQAFSSADWIASLKAVRESCRLRSGGEPVHGIIWNSLPVL